MSKHYNSSHTHPFKSVIRTCARNNTKQTAHANAYTRQSKMNSFWGPVYVGVPSKAEPTETERGGEKQHNVTIYLSIFPRFYVQTLCCRVPKYVVSIAMRHEYSASGLHKCAFWVRNDQPLCVRVQPSNSSRCGGQND